MASAIGWYVHLTRAGYREHGITTHERGWNKGWHPYHKIQSQIEIRAQRLNVLTKQEREQLQEALDFLTQDLEKGSSPQGKELQNQITEHMAETFYKDISEVDWDTEIKWDTLDVNLKHPRDWYVGRSKLRDEGGFMLDTTKTLAKIKQLEHALGERIANNPQQGIPSGVLQHVAELKKMYEQEMQHLNQSLSTLPKNLRELRKVNKKAATRLGNLRSELLRLIELYAAYPSVNLQKGELFEQVVGNIGYGLVACGHNAVSDVLVEGLQKNENVVYDLARFENLSNSLEKYHMPNGTSTLYITNNIVQGKVDVSFTWNTKPVRASVKNYDLVSHGLVHVGSDSPMAYLLQYEDAEFVNHFLNLWSHHNYDDVIPEFTARKNEIIKSIKLILFYKSLTGANLGAGRKSTNLFIINDNSTGKAKIYTMAEVIQKSTTDLHNYSVQVDGKPLSQMALLKNDWEGKKVKSMNDARLRINALLVDLHSRKVSAGINKMVLRSPT